MWTYTLELRFTISLNLPVWNNSIEPNQGNIRQWMDNLYSRFQPLEQARWNQSNIDTLFHAGCQSYVNRYFGFNPTSNSNQFYFNLVQQPCNMITGYQRQHRKNVTYQAAQGTDSARDFTPLLALGSGVVWPAGDLTPLCCRPPSPHRLLIVRWIDRSSISPPAVVIWQTIV